MTGAAAEASGSGCTAMAGQRLRGTSCQWLLMGNFMEPWSIILITVNMEIGMITPPVGLNLYVASGISKLGLSEMTVAVWPWLLTMLVFLVLITYWPPLTLWLPQQLGMIAVKP